MSNNFCQTRQKTAILNYYRWQARIYDCSRWIFLRGREELARRLTRYCRPQQLLEVGCGTGFNLLRLSRLFPKAHLWGLDLSPHMLALARQKLLAVSQRVTLVEGSYDQQLTSGQFDVVLFSYVLSMMNPGWDKALKNASHDLAPEGIIAVVDFHDTRSNSFKTWMNLNHVRLAGHLLPWLQQKFVTREATTRTVLRGLWSFFLFIGENNPP